jgi:hypothetical protein
LQLALWLAQPLAGGDLGFERERHGHGLRMTGGVSRLCSLARPTLAASAFSLAALTDASLSTDSTAALARAGVGGGGQDKVAQRQSNAHLGHSLGRRVAALFCGTGGGQRGRHGSGSFLGSSHCAAAHQCVSHACRRLSVHGRTLALERVDGLELLCLFDHLLHALGLGVRVCAAAARSAGACVSGRTRAGAPSSSMFARAMSSSSRSILSTAAAWSAAPNEMACWYLTSLPA